MRAPARPWRDAPERFSDAPARSCQSVVAPLQFWVMCDLTNPGKRLNMPSMHGKQRAPTLNRSLGPRVNPLVEVSPYS